MSGPRHTGYCAFTGKLRAGHTLPLRYCKQYTASINVSTSLKCSSIEQ